MTGSGELTEAELRTALVNGDWTPFDPHTVRMMIRMFDTNKSGTVNFDEFWYATRLTSLLLFFPFCQ
jgi:Ca2+-binding EF-hand superfamily protein